MRCCRALESGEAADVGIAVLRDGEVVWSGYYGEQAGLALSAATAFNTASVAKTITAETLLALAAKGQIDLDEPMARYVANAELEHDPRRWRECARLLVAGSAGRRGHLRERRQRLGSDDARRRDDR